MGLQCLLLAQTPPTACGPRVRTLTVCWGLGPRVGRRTQDSGSAPLCGGLGAGGARHALREALPPALFLVVCLSVWLS